MIMKSVDFYLHFNGDCEKAMNFYKSIFGGDFISVQRYSQIPGSEKMNEEDKEKNDPHVIENFRILHTYGL